MKKPFKATLSFTYLQFTRLRQCGEELVLKSPYEYLTFDGPLRPRLYLKCLQLLCSMLGTKATNTYTLTNSK